MTLAKEPRSKLAAIVNGDHSFSKDQKGRWFIDADGYIFSFILEYLRFGKLPPVHLASQVYVYANYFGLQDLEKKLSTFLPVIQIKFLDKIRLLYPNYIEIFNRVIYRISQRAFQNDGEFIHTVVRCVNAYKTEKDICTICNQDADLIYAVAADRHASDLITLLQRELKDRGFVVEEAVYCHCRNKIEYDKTNVENVFFHPEFQRKLCFVNSTDSHLLRMYDEICSAFSYTLKIKLPWI